MHAQAEHGEMFNISSLEDNNMVKFFKAVQSGDTATVKAYLDLGVPVDLTDEDGWSPVHHAIAHGQVEVIRLLMDRGCCLVPVKNSNLLAKGDIFDAARSGNIATVKVYLDVGVPVDLTDEDGWSPVHHAIAHGQVEVIRLLMDRGCCLVPVKNSNLLANEDILKDGDTGGDIFDAARSGNIATVKVYLDVGVPVDLTDEDGWSPVHHAIAHGQVEVVRLLMDRGCCMSPVKSRIPPSADYAGVHNSRKCGIFDAARSGDTAELKEYLELGVSVDATDEDGRTPLHCAAGEGQLDAVKLLINKGCCIDPADNDGWTPSMYAGKQVQYGVVLLLYYAKCVRDSTGWTPLHVAARNGQLELIEILLSVGGRKLMTMVAGEAGTPLHQAARRGHKDVVTRLLNEGCPVDIRDSNGFTALYVAAQRGQVVIIEMLVNHGFDVNAVDNEGMTPLHSAANCGQLESIHTLLRLGGRKSLTKIANTPGDPLHLAVIHGQFESVNTLLRSGGRELPTKTVKVGGTPLHQAAGMGHKEIVTLLLNEGSPIGIRDNHGNSALHLAACFGRVHVIEELVMRGLDVNVEDNEGCTPLHYAATRGQLKSIQTLLRLGGRKSLTKIARVGGTPLHQAVAGGHKDMVTLLLNEGCPVTTLSCSGASVLHMAAQFGQEELIGYLIDCGLDANIEDDDGRTPLHHAAILGQLESVHALLRLGGRRAMTMIARGAGTPLHFAVNQGKKDMVLLLLCEGCPMNVTTSDGLTALHTAAGTGQVDIIEMLAGHGLDVDIHKDGGLTPLHVAAYHNQLESAHTLVRLGGRRLMTVIADGQGTPLHLAAARGHKDMVSLLLKEGCPVNVTGDNGQSAVHFAATSGKVDIIEMLVNHGLDVNLVDNKGCTPLHAAAAQGQLESVRTLLRLGGKASMTMVAGKYGTPLHQAIANGSHGMVTLLLDEGSPVNVTTCDGISALHSAARKERVDLIDMLVKRGCDANAVDVHGWTPVFYGIFHMELMHRLRMSGARIPPLFDALHLELMKRLFLFGARISHHDNFGIKLYEYFIASACVSSHTMKSYVKASGIACEAGNFVNVISTLSKNDLIDINRVLCLAAVSGHVELFDAIVDSDLPLDQQRMPNLLQALCIRLEDWEVIDNSLEDFHILDDRLNPLHLSLISCKQFGPGAQSAAQHKYAARVISHPRTKYTIHELFPNGLSPLDIACQFEFHDIAGMIEKAGGRPGMWVDLPKETGQKSMEILRSLRRVRGSEFGEDYIRTLLMMCGCMIKEEEGSKAAQNDILKQTPEQSDVEEYVLSNVKELRKWRRVGDLLKVDAPVLDKLAKDADGSGEVYCSMLKYWLEHGRSVTWKTLLDAIGHFETKTTMEDIRKKIERGLSVTNVGGHVTC